MASTPTHILIVANRTAATPTLLDEVRRRAEEGDVRFSLLIPDVKSRDRADWTLDRAIPLLERAARGPVEGLVEMGDDPYEAVRKAVAERQFDEILVSTLSKRTSRWLRRDLPSRVERLGLPVTIISDEAEHAAAVEPAPPIRGPF